MSTNTNRFPEDRADIVSALDLACDRLDNAGDRDLCDEIANDIPEIRRAFDLAELILRLEDLAEWNENNDWSIECGDNMKVWRIVARSAESDAPASPYVAYSASSPADLLGQLKTSRLWSRDA